MAGKRHGQGFCKFADGVKFRGEWEDDGWVQVSPCLGMPTESDVTVCKIRHKVQPTHKVSHGVEI